MEPELWMALMAICGLLTLAAGIVGWIRMTERQKRYVMSAAKAAAGRLVPSVAIVLGSVLLVASFAIYASAETAEPDISVSVVADHYDAFMGCETFFDIVATVDHTGDCDHDLEMRLHSPAELRWETWQVSSGEVSVVEVGTQTFRPTTATWDFAFTGAGTAALTATLVTRAHESSEDSSAPPFAWTSTGTMLLLEWGLGEDSGTIEVVVTEPGEDTGEDDDTETGDTDEEDDSCDDGCTPDPETPPYHTYYTKSFEHQIPPKIDILEFAEITSAIIERSEQYTDGSISDKITTVSGAFIEICPAYRIVTVSSVRVQMSLDTTGFPDAFESFELRFLMHETGASLGSMAWTPGSSETLTLTIAIEVPEPGTRTVCDVWLGFCIKAPISWTLFETFLPFDPETPSTPTCYDSASEPPTSGYVYFKSVDVPVVEPGAQDSVSDCSSSTGLGEIDQVITREESDGDVFAHVSEAVSGIPITGVEYFHVAGFATATGHVSLTVDSIQSTGVVVESYVLRLSDSAGAETTMTFVDHGQVCGDTLVFDYTGTLSVEILSLVLFFPGCPGEAGSTEVVLVEVLW